MTTLASGLRAIALSAVMLIGGCAPAYYSYTGCHVAGKYCPPPPLPYTHYEGCICHSCAVSDYLSRQPQTVSESADSEITEPAG